MRKEVEEAQIGMRKASPSVIHLISCTPYLRRSVRTSSSPWSRSDWWEAPRTATVRGEGGSVFETKGRFDLDKLRDRTSAGAGAPKVGAQGPPRRLAIYIRSCYYIYAIRNLQKLTEGACGKRPLSRNPPRAWHVQATFSSGKWTAAKRLSWHGRSNGHQS